MSLPSKNPFGEQAGPANPYAAPGMQGYGGQQAGYLRPHRGGLILTLGIIGLVLATLGGLLCGFVPLVALTLSIPAWLMGAADLKAINRGEIDPQGRGATSAGMITGIVGTVIGGLVGLIIVAVFFFLLVMVVIGAASDM